MRRAGFVLGLWSVGGQVLLLRELVSSLNGDELFIGTALFGWLLSVACGAFIGGRMRGRVRASVLLLAGIVAAPLLIALVRLSPLIVTALPGEIVPFLKAALLSIVAMAPVGMISGWLFAAFAADGEQSSEAIIIVYLFEGIGAFAGGILITALSGGWLTSIAATVIVNASVLFIAYFPTNRFRLLAGAIAYIIIIIAAITVCPAIDRILDGIRYAPYMIAASFDTPYGHQTLLSRDNSLVLLTDNTIEAVYPDRETSENQILPPLLYFPDARTMLVVGRTEFGVGELIDSLPGLTVTAVDRRRGLQLRLQKFMPSFSKIKIVDDDPLRYLTRLEPWTKFDIIVLNSGEPDTYQSSRFFTEPFLQLIRRHLADDGILFIPTRYDSDRYLGTEKKQVLSVIYQTLAHVFPNLALWPGTSTLFLASPERDLALPIDSLLNRASTLPLSPQYISGAYLPDRLEAMKAGRLTAAVQEGIESNSLDKPLLPHYQALYRSLADSYDRKILGFVLQHPRWLIVVPLAILFFLSSVVFGPRGRRRFPLFLFFVAGAVSLSLELLSFYLFQSTAGSLYSEMAILIGAFMLGLAAGTYYAQRAGRRPVEYVALGLMATAILLFLTTWRAIPSMVLLVFHSLFLFTIALATGTLFVGATNRFYPWSLLRDDGANRGAGYGWELVGSALGALVTTTLILPVIGLSWLLWSLVILVVVGLAGTVVSSRAAGSR